MVNVNCFLCQSPPEIQKTYMATALRETTRKSYDTNFRVHILPELGSLRLNEIERERMERFVVGLVEKGLSKHSIRLVLAALSVVLNSAIE